MASSRLSARLARLVALAGMLPLAASAVSYFKWEAIELPASSGASCGNGTPYRFFVNRTPFTTKTVIIFEGGGACWAQNSCQMKGGPLGVYALGATNFKGIAPNYMTNFLSGGLAFGGLITPLATRIDPLQGVQTQSWNIVYAPYCTGDVHTGNKVAVYNDADPSNPLTYFHRGGVNGQVMASWLGSNFPRPDKLLVSGFSAGATGATAQYAWIRQAMNPKTSALLADSGPLFHAPRGSSSQQSPSLPLHNRIREAWGLDGPQGIVTQLLSTFPNIGRVDDLGSVTTGVAKAFPQDRFNYSTLQLDGIYSAFSYVAFYPEIAAAPSGAPRDALMNAKWRQDLTPWMEAMKPVSNIGYYVPYGRDILKSHTLSTLTFAGTAIKEVGISSVGVVIDNLIDGKGTPLRAFETAKNPQNTPSSGFLDTILQPLYALIGF